MLPYQQTHLLSYFPMPVLVDEGAVGLTINVAAIKYTVPGTFVN